MSATPSTPARMALVADQPLLGSALTALVLSELKDELDHVQSTTPLGRKSALKVAQKRTAATLTGLLTAAAESLQSEWEQSKMELAD